MNKKYIFIWLLSLCLLAAVQIPARVQAASVRTGERLASKEAVCYQYLCEMAAAVAAGEQASASVNIPLEALGIKNTYTEQDLGVDTLFDSDGLVTPEVKKAMREQLSLDCIALYRSLLSDHPYELYWFDKSYDSYTADTRGLWISVPSVVAAEDQQTVCFDSDYLKISMKVSAHYGSFYSADTAKTKAASAAAEKAKAIVSECASLSDVEKLTAYKDTIIGLTDYHKSATEDLIYGRTKFGNPWQLIYVFDEDPDTKVVCEGYAKAFQYLCDLTVFSDPTITCRCVTGLLSSSSGAADEAHMWNVVSIDGRNYLVDITNSETGTPGEDGSLFLAGAAGSGQTETSFGSTVDAYHLVWTYGSYFGDTYYPDKAWCTYKYDTEALCTYMADELTLSPYSYRLDHIGKPDLTEQITVSIYGDSPHRIQKDGSNLHTYSQGNLQVWEDAVLFTVPAGATVREATDLFFAQNGYLADYRSAHGTNMISWLYREEDTPPRDLSDGSNGADSRWMYLVNDTYTDAPDDTILHDQDSLVLHFSDAPQSDIEAALQRADERAQTGSGDSSGGSGDSGGGSGDSSGNGDSSDGSGDSGDGSGDSSGTGDSGDRSGDSSGGSGDSSGGSGDSSGTGDSDDGSDQATGNKDEQAETAKGESSETGKSADDSADSSGSSGAGTGVQPAGNAANTTAAQRNAAAIRAAKKKAAKIRAAKKTAAKISAAKKRKVRKLKVRSRNRKLIVSWKKTNGADGYQVQYRIPGKKWKYLKRSTIKNTFRSKKLKKGKRYSVRVRTYTKVNSRKVYGKWSSAKSVN